MCHRIEEEQTEEQAAAEAIADGHFYFDFDLYSDDEGNEQFAKH